MEVLRYRPDNMPSKGSKKDKIRKEPKPIAHQEAMDAANPDSSDRAGQAKSGTVRSQQHRKHEGRAESEQLSAESQTGALESEEHASANEEESEPESEQPEEQEETSESDIPDSTDRKRKHKKEHSQQKHKNNKKARKEEKRREKRRSRKRSSSSESSNSSTSSGSESSDEYNKPFDGPAQPQKLDDVFRTRLVKLRKDIGRSYQITPWGGEESKLRAFLDSLKTTYMALSVDEEKMKIHLTKTFISNFAIVSWLNNVAPSMATFADLETAMLTEYSIVDVKLELVRDLKRLRQGDKSPKDYGLEFNALVQRFRAHFPGGITDELLVLAFKDGCEPSVFNKVDWSRAKTPREAASLVSSIKDAPRVQHHQNSFSKRDDQGRKPKHHHKPYQRPSQTQSESASGTPADTGTTLSQASSANPNLKSSGAKTSDSRQPRVCFKCNKPGHLSFECRRGNGKGRRE